MQPQFVQNRGDEFTPPTTGIHDSQEQENSRKNTMNHKQKQAKAKPTKGSPYQEDSNSSTKKPQQQQNMASLGDLPGFGNQ